jgi:hypothetical protein
MADEIGQDDSGEVGYKKPPRAMQFQKGRSGNPNGRPKGSKNLATIVQQDGRQRVRVNGPHGVRTITKQEAVVMQLGNKAAQGDLAATRAYIGLLQYCESAGQTINLPPAPHERDAAVMKNMLERIRRTGDSLPPDSATISRNQQEAACDA